MTGGPAASKRKQVNFRSYYFGQALSRAGVNVALSGRAVREELWGFRSFPHGYRISQGHDRGLCDDYVQRQASTP